MNKLTIKLIMLTLLAITSSLSFSSCKKERATELYQNSGSIAYAVAPNGVEPIYVENKLKWIARSLPILARNVPGFASTVQNCINSSSEKKSSNAEIQVAVAATPSPAFDYNGGVYDTVNGHFPGNDYDSAYFFSFEYEDCMHTTTVRFQETTTFTLSDERTLVVIAFFESLDDTMTGYYYDTLTNTLDSMLVYPENSDNYDIWIVDADNQCLEGPGGSGPIFSFSPEGHCGDGTCQPFFGETPANCSDCAGMNTTGTYTLILKEFQHKIDHNETESSPNIDGQNDGYHEAYFGSKYDIFFSYAVITRSNGFDPPFVKDAWFIQNVTKRAFLRDWYEDNHGYDTKKWTDLMLRRIKKHDDDVVRAKPGSGSSIILSSGATPTVFTVDKVLSYHYDPTTDEIYVDMLEWDRGQGVESDPTVIDDGIAGNVSVTFKYRQKNHFLFGANEPNLFKSLPYFYGAVPQERFFNPSSSTNGFWQDGSSLYGSGSYYVDVTHVNSNAAFADFKVGARGTDGKGQIDLVASEMRTRYVLIPNP